MGEKPPAFDILAWNADGTNLPGALHCQFLDIFQDNLLVRSEAMSVLGTPLQLDRIKVPTFVTGAIADHLTPWKGCYRTTQLLGGDNTFVLSYSGHIASLVNPPDNPKAHHWAGGDRKSGAGDLVGGVGRLDRRQVRRTPGAGGCAWKRPEPPARIGTRSVRSRPDRAMTW
jgi:polyhydroxyalkanoate synthase